MPFPIFDILGLLFEGSLHLAANAAKDEKDQAPRRSGADRCPGCLGPLRDAVVRCGSCDTPHHATCYAARGGCAIAACSARGE